MTDAQSPRPDDRPGRHRNDDDWDGDHATAQSGAATGAIAGTGTGAVAAESDAGGGMPLRGLAMICIFIGVCLMGWGLYAWTSGNGDSDGGQAAEGGSTTVADAPATASAPDGAGAEAGAASERPDAQAPASTTPAPPAAPAAPAPGEVRRADVPVTVLNNSTVVGLAGTVSDQLAGEGWGRGTTGNAPEGRVGVWERTTVLYTPGNAAEQAAAEEIGRQRGWAVAPRGDDLRDAPGGVVVVAAEDAR